MPEGDTVHKVAAVVRETLVGERLDRVELDRHPFPDLERPVVGVEAVGKHLLIELEGGVAVRTHLGLHGSWHRYRRGEPWQRPASQASVALWTDARVVVCFNAKEVDFVGSGKRHRHRVLGRLGPDLLAPSVDLEEVVKRARRLGDPRAPIVDLLLDQRVAAGLGNVYKSELLFLAGLEPSTPLERVSDAALRELYFEGRRLLQANLGGAPRTTTRLPRVERSRRPRLFVYGRGRRPCLRCDTPIRWRRMGRGERSTYWCPVCQPATGE